MAEVMLNVHQTSFFPWCLRHHLQPLAQLGGTVVQIRANRTWAEMKCVCSGLAPASFRVTLQACSCFSSLPAECSRSDGGLQGLKGFRAISWKELGSLNDSLEQRPPLPCIGVRLQIQNFILESQ